MAYDSLLGLLRDDDPRAGAKKVKRLRPNQPVVPELNARDIAAALGPDPARPQSGPVPGAISQTLPEALIGGASMLRDPRVQMALLNLGAALGGEGSWQAQLGQTAGAQVQNQVEGEYLQRLLGGQDVSHGRFEMVRPETVASGQAQLGQRQQLGLEERRVTAEEQRTQAGIEQGGRELSIRERELDSNIEFARERFEEDRRQFGEAKAQELLIARMEDATRRYAADRTVEAARVSGAAAAERAGRYATTGTGAVNTAVQALMVDFLGDVDPSISDIVLTNALKDPVAFARLIQDPTRRAEFQGRMHRISEDARNPVPTGAGGDGAGVVDPDRTIPQGATEPGTEAAPIPVPSLRQALTSGQPLSEGMWIQDQSTGEVGPLVRGVDGQLRINSVAGGLRPRR